MTSERSAIARELNRDPGAVAGLRLDRDRPAVLVHDPLGNRQAKPRAFGHIVRRRTTACSRGVAAIEPLEDVRQLIRLDSDALVGDGQTDARRSADGLERERAATAA